MAAGDTQRCSAVDRLAVEQRNIEGGTLSLLFLAPDHLSQSASGEKSGMVVYKVGTSL